MIQQSLLEELLGVAMSTGGDFAEIYAEHTRNNSVQFLDRRIDRITDTVLSGVGIRIFCGERTVYASTSDLTREGLLACARSAAAAMGEGSAPLAIRLSSVAHADAHPVRIDPNAAPMKLRTDILKSACFASQECSELITQVQGTLLGVDHEILVANSEGLLVQDRHVRTRIVVNAVASKDGENQSGGCAPGRGMGLELFDLYDPAEVGRHAAEMALVNLRAEYCKAGQMTVAIENGFGGVIFHEACGHSLEATQVGVGMSEMCGKLGQKIANEKITAIDDGTIPGAWGSVNIDDEGTPTQRNVLIEKGILKSYMVDRLGSRRLGLPMTGNSRRQGYTYEPTSRMTNTFIDNGPDRNEDIIASIEYGLYAKEMGGGSVNPLTGAFNFSVREGYMIRNGKICEPVRGASLIGTGSQILQDIDMVGQNLATGQGMCGSASGNVPTDVGQPLIRVKKITVGGR
ncbi:MAG: TldD/PmbA family protein [Ruminococcaceae bacterium]|nr:TldD/PmbA family protein [Oscillospiraceae bacterium]